jgi:hypothetical protein
LVVDPHSVVREFLLTGAALRDLVGERIYAGRDVPVVGYKPEDGPCVAFRVRGGGPDYEDALLNPSVQFKCYAGNEVEAYAAYGALYDHLHNGHGAGILHAEIETLGELLEEPETEWHFVLTFFIIQIRQ